MINSFVMIIKLGKMNLTTQQLTNLLLNSFSSSSSRFCRKCRSVGIKKYCRYIRKLTDFKGGKRIDYDLSTWRFKCDSCGSTHAFLVPLVIPYCRHSILVVIRALYEYYDTGSVKKVCDKYDISAPTLYRWKALFLKHKEEWLGYLKDAEMKASDFLKHVIEEVDYSTFSLQFMQGQPDHRTFMQNHKNANNHQFV